ncbi:DNA repair protein RadC [Spiroplasma ixodetis Y32]|nr:DNA repair protein RadC [Spiroplasma ixodetis Y32]
MVPWRILNVWWHFKHLILLKLEVFKLVQEHMIHLFFFKLAIYFKQSCSVWKALLNSFNFIVSSTSTCGEKSVKNLWNSVSGSIKLPGGIESKWDSSKDDSKDLAKIKDEFNKFQEKLTHLIPPFINFKELNNTKKPREKAIKYGFDALSDNELLAIILRTGTKEKNVLFLAQEIITNFNGLENLNKVTIKSLMSIKGIGVSKALEILSCLEIVKRIRTIESQKNILKLLFPKMFLI